MYLFKEHNIAALHINKNAGSSLRVYLVDLLGEYELLTPDHGLLEYKYPQLPKDCNILATVRNPFDRMVSMYYQRKNSYNPNGIYAGNWKNMLRDAATMDLKTWFIRSIKPNFKVGPPEDQPIFQAIQVKGQVPENVFIAKVETLQEDVDRFLAMSNVLSSKKFPRKNVNETRPPWQELYDDELKKLMYEWDKFTFDNYYKELVI
jgi:hypothetical protein